MNCISTVLKLAFLIWILSSFSSTQGCDSGWFGSSCHYKCHCTGNNCDTNGDCTSTNTCVKGWFGPQCQYVDLTTTLSTAPTPAWLSDGDDGTCNTDQTSQTVTITLNQSLPFSWIRVLVNDPASLQNINIGFTSGSRNNLQCENLKKATVDDLTIDVHCDLTMTVTEVILSGSGVKSLCSVYISGGRNVALKKTTSQSSTFSSHGMDHSAIRAVDGDTNGNFRQGSCTHTQPTDPDAEWEVNFPMPHYIDRYLLYNRLDEGGIYRYRLSAFVLTSFTKTDQEVFSYQDPGTPLSVDVYTVIPGVAKTSDISRVVIKPTYSLNGKPPILTLCEIEIYGDAACPERKYGRECEYTCNCAIDEACFVSTGGCPSGCAPGYLGEHCNQTCASDKWGPGCSHDCNSNCTQSECDHVTGICNDCPAGKTGDLCDQDCPETTYGPRCIHNCSDNCEDRQCYTTNGTCIQCLSGVTGYLCDQACDDDTWGPRCINNCSSNCTLSKCDGFTGVCEDCPEDKTGDQCDQAINSSTAKSTSPDNSDSGAAVGIGVGVGLAVVVAAVVVVVGIFWYRRRSAAKRSAGQTTQRYDALDIQTNSMKPYAVFKRDDEYIIPTDPSYVVNEASAVSQSYHGNSDEVILTVRPTADEGNQRGRNPQMGQGGDVYENPDQNVDVYAKMRQPNRKQKNKKPQMGQDNEVYENADQERDEYIVISRPDHKQGDKKFQMGHNDEMYENTGHNVTSAVKSTTNRTLGDKKPPVEQRDEMYENTGHNVTSAVQSTTNQTQGNKKPQVADNDDVYVNTGNVASALKSTGDDQRQGNKKPQMGQDNEVYENC